MPHVKPLLIPDMQAEADRQARAVKVRTAYEAEWWRDDSAGGWPRFASRLRGPWGDAMRRAMEGAFASGATQIQVEGGGTQRVRGFRWVQLEEKLDPTLQPLKDMAIRLSLLYRPPPGRPALDVNGDMAVPSWQWLAKRADLDGVCMRRQAWMIGRQCAAVRPTLREFVDGQHYPPGLVVLGADQLWAVEDPVRPGVAVVVGETLPSGRVLIWDCADPRRPYWGEWKSTDAWRRGAPAIWMQEGWDYPWRWRSAPFVPVIITRWDVTATELLPADLRDYEAARAITLMRMWHDVVMQAGSFNKAVLLSANGMDGVAQSMQDPTVIQAFSGAGPWDLKTIPHSLDGVKVLSEIIEARMLEWARRFDAGHEVRRESGSSGYAISLQMTGQYLLRQQMEARARSTDAAIVRSLVVTWNYLVQARMVGIRRIGDDIDWDPDAIPEPRADVLIPETEPDLAYPHLWRPEERAERRVEIEKAVDAGMESPRALWLFDRQMEDDRPDGPNWLEADAGIRAACSDALTYAALGYGQRWTDRLAMTRATPEDETALYVPPADVADTAAEGLRLRDAFPGRAIDGKTADGKRLLGKAKALRNQTPMMAGEVRALNVWLRAHEGDAGLDADVGTWGNAEDPSGAWITYLSQGGDPGLAWTNATLAPVVEPAQEEGAP